MNTVRDYELGAPLPAVEDAVSVSLPRWGDVIDYEKGLPRVVSALRTGYPRFVIHPCVEKLFRHARGRNAREGEEVFVFPCRAAAERAMHFLLRNGNCGGRIVELAGENSNAQPLAALFFPEHGRTWVKLYWQHAGEIISSRRARAFLSGCSDEAEHDGKAARTKLRKRIAELAGGIPSDVYLFASGMAAAAAVLRAVCAICPGMPIVQFGFPYVDLLKLQERCGSGVAFFPRGDGADLQSLTSALKKVRHAGLFAEFPGNPLLRSVDIAALSTLCRDYKLPFIIDDTLGSLWNSALLPYSDALMVSLTKYFSGGGDVMGGALILNNQSTCYRQMKELLLAENDDGLWCEDAAALASNSRDFALRMEKVNTTAFALASFLRESPRVQACFYPAWTDAALYLRIKRARGGFGGLVSFVLKGGEKGARAFFDSLPLAKGPGFGNSFTIVSPAVLLAHYQELPWAEACGVPRNLIRVSVGLEEEPELRAAFHASLSKT